MNRKPLTVADLPAPRADSLLPGGVRMLARQPMLYCPSCGDESSANPGDYWSADPATPIHCDGCGQPVVLADKFVVHIPATPDRMLPDDLTDLLHHLRDRGDWYADEDPT